MKRGEWSFRGFDTEKETGFLPVSFSICAPSTHRTKPSPRGRGTSRIASTVGVGVLDDPAERTDGIANPGRTRNRPPFAVGRVACARRLLPIAGFYRRALRNPPYVRIGQNTIAPKTGNLAPPPACVGRRGRRPLRIKLPHCARAVDEGRPPRFDQAGQSPVRSKRVIQRRAAKRLSFEAYKCHSVSSQLARF